MVGNSARHRVSSVDNLLHCRNILVYPAILPYGAKDILPLGRRGLVLNLEG